MNVETLVPRLFSIVQSWKAQRIATCGTCAYAMHNMQALHEVATYYATESAD